MSIPNILTFVFTAIIFVFSIYVWYRLHKQSKSFEEISEAFEDGTITKEITRTTANEASFSYDDEIRLERRSSSETSRSYHWDKLEEYKKKYFETYANYVSVSQMIALFPLMGILGTVVGLILGGEIADIESITSGLKTAMWTTFAGLLASIILKFYDARSPGKKVNIVEGKFSIAEEAFHMETIKKELKKARAGE